ncbi:formamidopyrimidine-DNA glycosylase isoform X3 [Asparagus officinalis]|uniref:formamidopyrimidine-DNA glycosylase isoform X3 n=1 Tax=Asparagus officinalis TaxID=4686 RepID=UPI00098DF19E|nr:formamidopyrimidine-DNA glycosylase isoform X3 [Asparagus officinalis]
MPELPEVEAARRAIQENCINKRIRTSTIADDPKVIGGVSPSEFQSSINGKTIVAAHRKGKNLWLQLDSPPFPSFQFGMTGAVYIKGVAVAKYKRSAVSDEEEWPSKYSKFFIVLEDGLELSFTDKRRFAKVRLLQDPTSVPPISELGPDALLEPMKVEEFVDSLSKKKIAIKALLLDQGYISGIGNWVADEVLYQARIHPLQVAATLSKESCETLHCCIKEVVNYAVEVDADSNSFPIEWLFHFRWGKKSGKVNAVEVGADSSQYPSDWIFHSREKKPGKAFVDGKKVDFITAGGRTSAYVPELQKLSGAQTEKKGRQGKPRKEESDEEPEPEDEENGSSKSRKSKKAAGGSKKQKKKVRQDDSDDDDSNSDEDEKPQKSAKRSTRKQPGKQKKKARR